MTAVVLNNGPKVNLVFPRDAQKDRACECTFHLLREALSQVDSLYSYMLKRKTTTLFVRKNTSLLARSRVL